MLCATTGMLFMSGFGGLGVLRLEMERVVIHCIMENEKVICGNQKAETMSA